LRGSGWKKKFTRILQQHWNRLHRQAVACTFGSFQDSARQRAWLTSSTVGNSPASNRRLDRGTPNSIFTIVKWRWIWLSDTQERAIIQGE